MPSWKHRPNVHTGTGASRASLGSGWDPPQHLPRAGEQPRAPSVQPASAGSASRAAPLSSLPVGEPPRLWTHTLSCLSLVLLLLCSLQYHSQSFPLIPEHEKFNRRVMGGNHVKPQFYQQWNCLFSSPRAKKKQSVIHTTADYCGHLITGGPASQHCSQRASVTRWRSLHSPARGDHRPQKAFLPIAGLHLPVPPAAPCPSKCLQLSLQFASCFQDLTEHFQVRFLGDGVKSAIPAKLTEGIVPQSCLFACLSAGRGRSRGAGSLGACSNQLSSRCTSPPWGSVLSPGRPLYFSLAFVCSREVQGLCKKWHLRWKGKLEPLKRPVSFEALL